MLSNLVSNLNKETTEYQKLRGYTNLAVFFKFELALLQLLNKWKA